MQSRCFYIRYGIENGSCRGSIRGIFVSSLNCYQLGECFRQKEVIRSNVVLKKDAIFYLLWQVIDFSGICKVNEFFWAIMLWGQRMANLILNLFWNSQRLGRWLFVYKKCKLACLFGLAPHSLIEGEIFWLGYSYYSEWWYCLCYHF